MLLSDRAVTAIVIAVPILAVGLLFSLRCYCNTGFDRIAFEESAWKTADRERRGHMADDVVDQQLLIGKTPEGVRAILSDPDEDQRFDSEHRVRYHLGHRGRNPDCPVPLTEYSLLVWFDSRETVEYVTIAD